jgi:hypothetical protein
MDEHARAMVMTNHTATPGHYHPSTAQITVTAHAWVGAEVVERTFRDAQRQVIGSDAYQPKDERTLKVLKFVAGRMRESEEETWDERRKAWNETCPEGWHCKTYNGFRQVYEERFIDPVRIPGVQPTELRTARESTLRSVAR